MFEHTDGEIISVYGTSVQIESEDRGLLRSGLDFWTYEFFEDVPKQGKFISEIVCDTISLFRNHHTGLCLLAFFFIVYSIPQKNLEYLALWKWTKRQGCVLFFTSRFISQIEMLLSAGLNPGLMAHTKYHSIVEEPKPIMLALKCRLIYWRSANIREAREVPGKFVKAYNLESLYNFVITTRVI